MDERIKPGDTIQLDTDKWIHHGEDYFVHKVKYKEPSTTVQLTLEDKYGNISTIVLASNQVIKV